MAPSSFFSVPISDVLGTSDVAKKTIMSTSLMGVGMGTYLVLKSYFKEELHPLIVERFPEVGSSDIGLCISRIGYKVPENVFVDILKECVRFLNAWKSDSLESQWLMSRHGEEIIRLTKEAFSTNAELLVFGEEDVLDLEASLQAILYNYLQDRT